MLAINLLVLFYNMASKLTANPILEKAIKDLLKGAKDFKDKALAINLAIKWEAVKMKMSDADFGSHFETGETDVTDPSTDD